MTAIAFRVDASSSIGSGHITRCVTLARELSDHVGTIIFVIRTDSQANCSWLQDQGFLVRRLAGEGAVSAEADAEEFLAVIGEFGRLDWLIVDHYLLGAQWEASVRAATHNILAIDDLGNRAHDCDLLLDQNLYTENDRPYAGLIARNAALLIGPRFALLRPEFAKLKAQLKLRTGRVNSALVCFGGADPNNHTAAAIEAIKPFASSLDSVTVVVGTANRNTTSILEVSLGMPNCTLKIAPHELPELLRNADLAIGGGGTMTWERACLEVPTVAVGIAANQVAVLRRLFEYGGALGVEQMIEPDVDTLRDLISVAMKSPAMLTGMSRRAGTLVDGLGARRVAERLYQDPVAFRPASMADCDAMLGWRNHADVRAMSFDTNEISLADHRLWMQRTLSNPNRILLIAECAMRAVGVVRFDLSGDAATISLYRIPGTTDRRVGLIRNASCWLQHNYSGVARIVAEVRSENVASYSAFLSAGYRESKKELVMEISA
jgi:UDP-2,4-diacetamido-2,4,6-trideoxy-beta-L-altropyranose hydrolase